MSKRTDSNTYTIIFAIVMVVVVGSVLAFVSNTLRPTISENERIEKMQNILYAMNVNNNSGKNDVIFLPTAEASEKFNQYIVKQYIIEGGSIAEGDAFGIDLAQEENLAKSSGYQKKLPVFVGNKDGNTYYIVPIRGTGLWGPIWGYISLNDELIIQGIFLDHASETPGLGANIKERFFMDDFIGEHIFDETGSLVGVAVSKGNNDPENNRKTDNKIDAISGSTITGDGVSAMIRSYLRQYVPHLQSIINN